MQVLFESSAESPGVKGFGSFTGNLEHLSSLEKGSLTPSIGWNSLHYTNHSPKSSNLYEAYFVHNYFASNVDKNHLVASYVWNNHEIPAYVNKGNIHGVQFHPEKSRIEGVNFLNDLLTSIHP
jgi:imidazole glycerol phosphate synthase glutamine amidotransferase subunit